MSSLTATRSAVIGLGEEPRAMQEGYVSLDEKFLLLASAMLCEPRRRPGFRTLNSHNSL